MYDFILDTEKDDKNFENFRSIRKLFWDWANIKENSEILEIIFDMEPPLSLFVFHDYFYLFS